MIGHRLFRCGVLVALLMLTACRSSDSPRGVAEGFLDAHYVHINLADAKKFCAGVALAKVEEEERLVGDQQIDASTRRPHVGYKFIEQKDEADDRVTLLYEGAIRSDEGDTTSLRWLITVRREADGWKVSNYKEFE